jgi:crotonobetainyl-CoA:carnitine CoA-transferase CaiB-like acyl-CoA transferase
MNGEATELRPAPLLGQHTAEVLCQELGLTAEEVGALAACGAVQG